MLHRELQRIFEAHNSQMTPVRAMLDADLAALSATFEEIELLNNTMLPIAYAQLTRLVCLVRFTSATGPLAPFGRA